MVLESRRGAGKRLGGVELVGRGLEPQGETGVFAPPPGPRC